MQAGLFGFNSNSPSWASTSTTYGPNQQATVSIPVSAYRNLTYGNWRIVQTGTMTS